MSRSIYAKLGGAKAIDSTVEKFYGRIMKDPSLAPMFQNTNMKKQMAHQAKFLTMALGGPTEYTGKGMRQAHARVNDGKHPTEEQFGAVAGHLVETLKELNVPAEDIDAVVEVVLTTKDDVLGK